MATCRATAVRFYWNTFSQFLIFTRVILTFGKLYRKCVLASLPSMMMDRNRGNANVKCLPILFYFFSLSSQFDLVGDEHMNSFRHFGGYLIEAFDNNNALHILLLPKPKIDSESILHWCFRQKRIFLATDFLLFHFRICWNDFCMFQIVQLPDCVWFNWVISFLLAKIASQ